MVKEARREHRRQDRAHSGTSGSRADGAKSAEAAGAAGGSRERGGVALPAGQRSRSPDRRSLWPAASPCSRGNEREFDEGDATSPGRAHIAAGQAHESWRNMQRGIFNSKLARGVATITLNRPERKNPLTFESYAELRDLFRAMAYADDVKAIVRDRARGKTSAPAATSTKSSGR